MTKYLDSAGLSTLATQIKENFISTKKDSTVDAAATITFDSSSVNNKTKITGNSITVGDDTTNHSFASISNNSIGVVSNGSEYANINPTNISVGSESGAALRINSDGISKTGGSANQVFTTNGGTLTVGTNKGNLVALGQDGKIPTSMLNFGDTSIFKVVPSLPTKTQDIDKVIYICPRGASGLSIDTTQGESGVPDINKYTEWLYTGEVGSGAEYEETYWEKLGEHDFNNIDLSGYYSKTQIQELYYSKSDIDTNFYTKTESDAKYNTIKNILFSDNSSSSGEALKISLAADQWGHGAIEADIPNASTSLPGLMTSADKKKLNDITSIESTEIEKLF